MSKKVFRGELKAGALLFIYLFMGMENTKKERGRGSPVSKEPLPPTSLLINENHHGSTLCDILM